MKALITGASSGIGRDMARILAEKGFDLVLVGRNTERLNLLKEELNTNVKLIEMDLSNPENCRTLYNENPNIDLLINNAGFGDCGEFTSTSLDKELNMINTNITAYHILTKLYLIDMKEKNHGHILNVASIAGFMPGPLMSTYYATKSYVVRLSEGIREELKRDKSKVKISILCPGPVDTNFNNTANVRFSLKGTTSKYVAEYALSHLNKFYIVPKFSIKCLRLFSHIVPSPLIAKAVYNTQNKKLEK